MLRHCTDPWYETRMTSADWPSQRHKTAIGRTSLSMPARQALLDGVLRPDWTALDYGSGRGQDVLRLSSMGLTVTGWDPHHGGHRPDKPRDVVTLTYVINVIEDAAERLAVIRDAWALTERCLAVSTRLSWERKSIKGAIFADGVVTGRNTFQHLFTPAELRSLVQSATGVRVVSPTPGMVYAFRHDKDRLAYLGRRALPDQTWQNAADAESAIAAVVDFLEKRGRMPTIEETPNALLPVLRYLSGSKVTSIARGAANSERVQAGRKNSILNTLLLLAIDLFNGRSSLQALPIAVQADIRAFFNSYREACRRADRLLLKLRDDKYLRNVMYNSAGKITPTAIYIHKRATQSMPVLLKLYEHCGAVAVGRPDQWDILKLAHEGRSVSWLGYPDFDRDPHPKLAWSYNVDMRRLDGSFRSYHDSDNRPILHRKHEFLLPDDPQVAKYRRLTAQEVRAGLYSQPHLIGNERGWEEALKRAGVELKGHRLVRRPQTAK